MERNKKYGIRTPADIALVCGWSMPDRDDELEIMYKHINGTERALAIFENGPRGPDELKYLFKYINSMYTNRMFDATKVRIMRHKRLLHCELLEWCDRPEDDRRRWHIVSRYLEYEE